MKALPPLARYTQSNQWYRALDRLAAPGDSRKNIITRPFGRPGRALVVVALGQDTLARTIGSHDTDQEPAPESFS